MGEGMGVFCVGEKKMQENAALKMAEKRALVDAVINTVPVAADRFTQDLEEGEVAPVEPAEASFDSAKKETWNHFWRVAAQAGVDEKDRRGALLALSAAVLGHDVESVEDVKAVRAAIDSGKYDLATGERK